MSTLLYKVRKPRKITLLKWEDLDGNGEVEWNEIEVII